MFNSYTNRICSFRGSSVQDLFLGEQPGASTVHCFPKSYREVTRLGVIMPVQGPKPVLTDHMW